VTAGARDLKCPDCGHGIETAAPLGKIPVWGECENHHAWLISIREPGQKPTIEPDPRRRRLRRMRGDDGTRR
jgi:hypothetical protein